MIQIITDSTSDISVEEAAKLGVEIVPLTVRFGDESFVDGISISNEDFFKRLREGDILPKTSQPAPFAFEEVYKKHLEKGDEIISIHISSALSGTYHSACLAAEECDSDSITVIDSLNATGGLGLLVRIAVKLRDEGKSYKEIADAIKGYINRVMLFVAVDTLEYLKKGGRIKPSLAVVGEVLSLHPMLHVANGEVEVPGKVIGDKAIIRWIDKKIAAVKPEPGLPVLVGHASAPERAQALFDKLSASGVNDLDDNFVKLGSVIGTYTGPGAVGAFYIAAE